MTNAATSNPQQARVERHELCRRILTVLRCEQLTPRMRRIILGGDDLETNFPYFTMAATDHVKVLFPDPETGELVVPPVGERGMEIDPQLPKPIYRDYTVRHFDEERRELTLDFVVHEHGIAGSWAANAQAGDQVGVLGPRGSIHLPSGYPWYVLAGDETAIPALARWIEELPDSARGVAIIEVVHANEKQELIGDAGIEVRYVIRDPNGSNQLDKAVRALELPESEYYVWMAGEATALKPIRRYFRRELDLPKERVDIDGYWKRGVTNLDHHATEDDED